MDPLEKHLQPEVISPTYAVVAGRLRLGENVYSTVGLMKDGAPLNTPLVEEPESDQRSLAMVAHAAANKKLRDHVNGARRYTIELVATPKEGSKDFDIEMTSTFPDVDFNPNDPLSLIVSGMGQHGATMIELMKNSNAEINKDLRPPSGEHGNAPAQKSRRKSKARKRR